MTPISGSLVWVKDRITHVWMRGTITHVAQDEQRYVIAREDGSYVERGLAYVSDAAHTYYLVRPVTTHAPAVAGKPGMFGDRADDLGLTALLFGVYLRELGNVEPGRYDGAALIERAEQAPIVRVCVGCNGAGTGRVVDLAAP